MYNTYEFASVAEAVSHFARQGFETIRYNEKNGHRVMHRPFCNGCQEVIISHNGLLDVTCTLETLASK